MVNRRKRLPASSHNPLDLMRAAFRQDNPPPARPRAAAGMSQPRVQPRAPVIQGSRFPELHDELTRTSEAFKWSMDDLSLVTDLVKKDTGMNPAIVFNPPTRSEILASFSINFYDSHTHLVIPPLNQGLYDLTVHFVSVRTYGENPTYIPGDGVERPRLKKQNITKEFPVTYRPASGRKYFAGVIVNLIGTVRGGSGQGGTLTRVILIPRVDPTLTIPKRNVRDIPMRNSEPTIHLLPGVSKKQNWHKQKGTCVIDYLIHMAQKTHNKFKKLAHGTKSMSAEKYWIKSIKDLFPDWKPENGITHKMLMKIAPHINFTYAGMRIDGSLVDPPVYQNNHGMGQLFCYITGEHVTPVETEDVLRHLEKVIRTTSYTAFANERKTSKTVFISHDSKFKDVVGDDREKKTILWNHPELSIIDLIKENYKETKTMPLAFGKRNEVLRLKYNNTTVKYHEDPEGCAEICELVGIDAEDKSIGTIASEIFKKICGDMPASNFNEQTRKAFDNTHSAYTVARFADVENHGNLKTIDINKCYSSAVLFRQDPWALFTPHDNIEEYSGKLHPLGWYLLELGNSEE